jgi:predicted polyphosphate/ATP-dependent NAD kinase
VSRQADEVLKIGFLVNPVAGIGGTPGLKGSDDSELRAAARAAGGVARGPVRAQRLLAALGAGAKRFEWFSWGGSMGAAALANAGLVAHILGNAPGEPGAQDTVSAARAMRAAAVDLLVFCGGDGTARDILDAIGDTLPVLGVPAGVKMHSGVFATTPEAAAAVLVALADGGLVRSAVGDVRDLDETALTRGEVRARYFGELRVPEMGGFLQHTKESGRENEVLALEEIVAEVVERIRGSSGLSILGPGSSVAAIKRALGMTPTLIGIDVLENGRQLGADVGAGWLQAQLHARAAAGAAPATLVLSFTRQQGFLIGRGNLQLTPAVLRLIGRERVTVVGTRSKLKSLDGRPLLLDTDDPVLDREWSGLIEIVSGYDDRLWYRVAATAEPSPR